MSAKPTHNLVVKTGEYLDRDGHPKARWLRIGKVFKHDDGGTSLKLDAMPVGLKDWDGWVSVFRIEDPAPQGQAPQGNSRPAQNAYAQASQASGPARPQRPAPVPQDFDDDIPF